MGQGSGSMSGGSVNLLDIPEESGSTQPSQDMRTWFGHSLGAGSGSVGGGEVGDSSVSQVSKSSLALSKEELEIKQKAEM